jgi:hypothetical protein
MLLRNSGIQLRVHTALTTQENYKEEKKVRETNTFVNDSK